MRPTILIYAFALPLLAACGHKDDAPAVAATSAVVTPAANDFQGGVPCGERVVHRFMKLDEVCSNGRRSREIRDAFPSRPGRPDEPNRTCEEIGNKFLQEYPQVDCVVSISDRNGQPVNFEIEERGVRRMLGRGEFHRR